MHCWVGCTFYLNPNFHFIKGILIFPLRILGAVQNNLVQGEFALLLFKTCWEGLAASSLFGALWLYTGNSSLG